jgi:hypothetical protein
MAPEIRFVPLHHPTLPGGRTQMPSTLCTPRPTQVLTGLVMRRSRVAMAKVGCTENSRRGAEDDNEVRPKSEQIFYCGAALNAAASVANVSRGPSHRNSSTD